MCCRADTNINALRLRRRALIFRDLPSNNVLISDNSRVRKSYFLNMRLTWYYVSDQVTIVIVCIYLIVRGHNI